MGLRAYLLVNVADDMEQLGLSRWQEKGVDGADEQDYYLCPWSIFHTRKAAVGPGR